MNATDANLVTAHQISFVFLVFFVMAGIPLPLRGIGM